MVSRTSSASKSIVKNRKANSTTRSICVSLADLEEWEKEAARQERSLSWIVRDAMAEYLGKRSKVMT